MKLQSSVCSRYKQTLALLKPRRRTKICYFFTLPGEIRNQIYRHFLKNWNLTYSLQLISHSDYRTKEKVRILNPFHAPTPYGALLVCRQFHAEFASIFYSEAAFQGPCKTISVFLNQIGEKNRRNLRQLSLGVGQENIRLAVAILRSLEPNAVPMKSLSLRMPMRVTSVSDELFAEPQLLNCAKYLVIDSGPKTLLVSRIR
jgi:hypothetical protein